MAPPRKFALGKLNASQAAPPLRKPGLVPVGVTRSLPADVLAHGEWSTAPDATRVWRLAIQSGGADSIRLHFNDFHVGTGKVWLLGTTADGAAQTIGPYTGSGPFADGEFWTDAIFSDSVTVAYQPASDSPHADHPPFRIVEVSHRFQAGTPKTNTTTRFAASAGVTPEAGAASCNLDVTCYADYQQAASAVALIEFQSDGGTYECTGSLIASAPQPAVPLFLTANHCIGTDTEARSVIAYFNYQTSACNGTPPSRSASPHVAGATYVLSKPMALGDFSLLQLSAFPSVDVTVLGWSADQIAPDAQVAGISHPLADYKRIAFGQRTADATIRYSGNESMPANMGYQVDWFQGTTQSGSSGSPLLEQINGKQYLVGTLSGGPDVNDNNSAQVCAVRNLNASYGRFTAALVYLADILNSANGTGAGTGTPSPQATITASPNPVQLAAGQTNGVTTLTWHATGVKQVQVRVNSPTGTPFTGIDHPDGSSQTGEWVTDGTTFYLQDATDGDSAGAAKTLASVRVRVLSSSNGGGGTGNPATRRGSLSADPNPVSVAAGQTTGSTTLTWTAGGVTAVQIRIGSPTGTALTGAMNPNGSVATGNVVTDGTVFYLQDASDGDSAGASKSLASVRVRVVSADSGGSNPSARQGTITATPNPIQVTSGSFTARTVLEWNAVGVSRVRIRAGSPNGPAVTSITGPSGSVSVRGVTDRLTFYLQDASDGRSTGASRTLATVTVHVISQ